MLDGNALYFTITDLKQYIYCPRILYYHTCLPDVRPVTYKMEAGIEAHSDERKRAARRSLKMVNATEGQRHFDLLVSSANLGLSGQIDEVVETEDQLVPVDYKLARQAGYHFKMQLTAYALLLEDTFQKRVSRGFIYLIPSRKALEVQITLKLRTDVQRALDEMRNIMDREQIPSPTEWRQRCVDCEFRRFCNDV